MHEQSEKLKKTGRNLKRIEKQAVPGLDKVLGLIKRTELRNKIIIAFVIALCIVTMIFLQLPAKTLQPPAPVPLGNATTIVPPKAQLKQQSAATDDKD